MAFISERGQLSLSHSLPFSIDIFGIQPEKGPVKAGEDNPSCSPQPPLS